MHMQSRKLMLASGIALASIGGLAVAGTAGAAAVVAPLAHSATFVTTIAPSLNILPNIAPNVAPTIALAPTLAISPTVTAPVLGASTVALAPLPGLK